MILVEIDLQASYHRAEWIFRQLKLLRLLQKQQIFQFRAERGCACMASRA